MFTKRLLTGSLLLPLLLQAAPLYAAEFGARLGVDSWGQKFSGMVNNTNSVISTLGDIDLSDDLGIDSDSGLSFFVVLEHPLGVVPNIRFQHTELETDNTAELSREIDYDGFNFPASQNVLSIVDLSHDDISFYWQPLQGNFNLGLGFTIRVIDGSFAIRDLETAELAIQRFDEAIPLPYVQSSYHFGSTGFSISADVNAAAYDGDKFVDTSIRLGWESGFGLGLEVGHRSITLDVQNIEVENSSGQRDELDIDLSAKGLFFGVFYQF